MGAQKANVIAHFVKKPRTDYTSREGVKVSTIAPIATTSKDNL